jgi:hypothetical protein
MEYGATERRSGSEYMQDVDTSPTRRMIAASIWHADCLRNHANGVAPGVRRLAQLGFGPFGRAITIA